MFPELGQKYCLYKCKVCGCEFEAMYYREYRYATGHGVEHCNLPVTRLKTFVMTMDGPGELQ